MPGESYQFANKRTAWETIAPLLDRGSPLRSSHLRDPVGPQIHFASESFMDELAAALNTDPVEFRLKHLKTPRDIAVIKAAVEKAGWQSRPSPRRDQTGNMVTGRGMAYVQRNGTLLAVVAEVDIDRSTGKIWARKFTVAHDCGQIINPDGLRHTIEGNIVQGVSRTLWEEVKFDQKNVTSTDWLTYPILDITETPQTIDIVLINRPEVAPTGAGEPWARCRKDRSSDQQGGRPRKRPAVFADATDLLSYVRCRFRGNIPTGGHQHPVCSSTAFMVDASVPRRTQVGSLSPYGERAGVRGAGSIESPLERPLPLTPTLSLWEREPT